MGWLSWALIVVDLGFCMVGVTVRPSALGFAGFHWSGWVVRGWSGRVGAVQSGAVASVRRVVTAVRMSWVQA